MACMEILQLTQEEGPSDRCHSMDWSLCGPMLNGRERTERLPAMAAEGFEQHCKAAGQVLKEEAAHDALTFLDASSLPSEVTMADQFTGPFSLSMGEKGASPQSRCCCESEMPFAHVDENTNHLNQTENLVERSYCQDQELLHQPDAGTELPPAWPYDPPCFASEEEEDAGSEVAGGRSIDYSFVSAILFLVIGILLVAISYMVPRDVSVDPNTVAAREMEQLEKRSAWIGAHLDRCVIAGLCLLTLGGVVLSSLLMLSIWKGELYRRYRFAASKESAKLYGSFNFRIKPSSNDNLELALVEEEALAVTS